MTSEMPVLQGEIVEYEEKNLTKNACGKAPKRDLRQYLTKEQVLELLQTVRNTHHQVFCATLYMTGLRVSEVTQLKKEDIDFKEGYITARWQKNRQWKNRKIALHHQLAPILNMFTAKMNQETFLFPFSRQRAWQITNKYFGVSPHVFRHTYSMHFLSNSKDPLKVAQLQGLLGHKHIQTTMEYVRLRPEHHQHALREVDFL
jgi:integrase/recombinase XerD